MPRANDGALLQHKTHEWIDCCWLKMASSFSWVRTRPERERAKGCGREEEGGGSREGEERKEKEK